MTPEPAVFPPSTTPLAGPIHWNLIGLLSLFGLVMGLATVYWIPASVELVIWFFIFDICAYVIIKRTGGRYFLHGFLTGLVCSLWITAIQILLMVPYLANHPEESALMSTMPLADSPRLVMLITGTVTGIVTGLILGFFAAIGSTFVKKPSDMIRMG